MVTKATTGERPVSSSRPSHQIRDLRDAPRGDRWEIGSGFPSLSAHVLVRPGDDCHAIRRELEHMLAERFQIEHTTLQVDHQQAGRLLSIGDGGADGVEHSH
jgi:Co/Zn/Cd efflux system component